MAHTGAPASAGGGWRRPPASPSRRLRLLKDPTWQDLLGLILSVVAVISVAVVLVFLVQGVAGRTIYIEPIAVPKTLADEGYGPDVAARRLQDAINRLRAPIEQAAVSTPVLHASERRSSSGLDVSVFASPQQRFDTSLPSDIPAIVIPGVGASLDSVAISIQRFFGWERRLTISGEFTIVGEKLWLVLRTNHRVIFKNEAGGDREKPDLLLDQASISLFDIAEPKQAAMIHNNLGKAKHGEGNTEEAISEYRKAMRLDGSTAIMHANLGNALADQGNPEEATAEYNTAIQLDPKSAPPHIGLGTLLSDQGKPDEAAAEYRTAIQLDPKFTLPHNNLGNLLSDQGKPDEATAEYNTAIRLDPKYAMPHIGLGNVLSSQGKPDEAAAEYRTAIQLDPKSALPHNNLGDVLTDQGKPDEAAAEYHTAIQLDPKYALPHNNLGNVLADQGKPDEAAAEYRTAIQLDPKSALPHNNLGIVLADQGKPDEAAAEYRTAIQLDPKYATAAQQPRQCPHRPGQARRGRRRIPHRDPARPQIRPAAQRPRQCPHQTRASPTRPPPNTGPRSCSTPNPPCRTTASALSSQTRASPTRPPPNTAPRSSSTPNTPCRTTTSALCCVAAPPKNPRASATRC